MMQRKGLEAFVSWIVVYLALRWIGPHVSFGHPIAGAIIGAVALMLVSLALIVAAARLQISNGTRWLVTLTALVVWMGLVFIGRARPGSLSYLSDVALITCATHFGVLVSSVIREPKLLLPVALCAGLVDIWGVNLGGPVNQIVKKAPKVIEKATAQVPAFGSAKIPKGKRPPPPMLIGFGDFVFLGIFFACILRFGMNATGSFWLTAASTIAALLVVAFPPPFARDLMLPGLPFMALGVILPNIRHFQFTRDEKFALLYAGLLLGVILAGAFVVSARVFR